ncbi:ABC transporter ATP-binding protein [Psittacicella gerlachiana]|uniref:ABC transporter domain-containing protein n=1 Tax=Psittacicella gerlachiana TaxID=2028574 RepID=A0A3A1Y621_9GAMM|nr:ABC transporter ATP-binding protein [Psittacicella gerlachiana]RIY31637.1 hypothetical protein CKF59_07500 [Psittacicella gerlachiana]
MTIEVNSLTVGYEGKSILQDLTFTLPQNQIIALLGVNGCGKSTLLKTLANIQPSISGNIKIDGESLSTYSSKSLAKKVAFLPQYHEIIEGITVYDFVAFGRTPYLGLFGKLSETDKEKIDFAMKLTNTYHLQNKQFSELSGGQRQSVCIAMAIAQDTNYILLDEPTTYLDLYNQLELMNIINELKKLNKTIIMVIHDLNQAFRYCDYLYVFAEKHLVCQGKPEEIVNEQMLKDNFKLNGTVEKCLVSHKPCFFAY